MEKGAAGVIASSPYSRDFGRGGVKGGLDMLKFGFGRWNELMTYPFPFKFLYEYLDKWCLDKTGRHWDEIEKLKAR